MEESPKEKFVRKCWEDLTKRPDKSLEELMGVHNKRLVDEYITYTPEERSIAEYVIKVYSQTASAQRADSNEKQWRAGVAISLLVSSTVFLLEWQRLTENDILTGAMTAIGAFSCIILGVYVGFHHRIMKWWHRGKTPADMS